MIWGSQEFGGRIVGSGEMADRIREQDWAATDLGPLETWPEAMVTSINLMLASPVSTSMYLGEQCRILYNDRYRPFVSGKHPDILGKPAAEVWSEVWHEVGPIIEGAAREGKVSEMVEFHVSIMLNGKLEDRWFTFACYPIYDQGRLIGTYSPAWDETEKRSMRLALESTYQEAYRTNEKLKLAMELANQGSFFYDERTGNITVDPDTRDLFELANLSGPAEYWISKVHPNDQERVALAFAQAASDKGSYDLEHRVVRSDGIRWLRARARRVSDPGDPVVLTGICEDITERKLAEEARDKERTTLRLAQQVAEIACWQWDVPTGNLVWVGDTQPLFGVPSSELPTAEQALSYVHPDDIANVRAALQLTLAGQSELNLEHRAVHPDGSIRWLAIKGRPIFDESGDVQALIGANTNVTVAREAQIAVLRATEQLALAVEAVDLATWFYDPGQGIVGGDSKMAALFGLPDAVGPAALWIARIHPDDQERVAGEFAAALQGSAYDTEYRVCPSGTSVRWVRARANRSQEDEARLIGICEDITERKQAEAELRSLSERLALASSTGLITSWDWDQVTNTLVWHGSERTWGRPTGDLDTPEKCFSHIHPEDAGKVAAALKPALDGSGEYQSEFRVCWPDGAVHWNAARGQGLSPDANGKPTRLIGVNQDITERKKSEAALIQTEKLAAVGRLASSIAHEINNPLEAVTNLIYLAKSAPEITVDTQRYLELADRELRRASNIASQTLRFHKQSSGPVLCSAEDLFREVLTVYQGRLANSRIQVQEQYRAAERVECFDGDIRQVLSNLVGNAIDSMPTGGRLLLRSRLGKEQRLGRSGMFLTVADTGTGMSAAVQRKLFEAFYSTKGIGGTGLGLWISKEIVDRHNGSLRLRSTEKVGHSGSVFTFFLPSDRPQDK